MHVGRNAQVVHVAVGKRAIRASAALRVVTLAGRSTCLGTEDAALALLFGLVVFRQIDLRKITGHQHVAKLTADDEELITKAA